MWTKFILLLSWSTTASSLRVGNFKKDSQEIALPIPKDISRLWPELSLEQKLYMDLYSHGTFTQKELWTSLYQKHGRTMPEVLQVILGQKPQPEFVNRTAEVCWELPGVQPWENTSCSDEWNMRGSQDVLMYKGLRFNSPHAVDMCYQTNSDISAHWLNHCVIGVGAPSALLKHRKNPWQGQPIFKRNTTCWKETGCTRFLSPIQRAGQPLGNPKCGQERIYAQRVLFCTNLTTIQFTCTLFTDPIFRQWYAPFVTWKSHPECSCDPTYNPCEGANFWFN